MFVSALELKRTVFRSDHASNWLVLKGTLGADKPRSAAGGTCSYYRTRSSPAAPGLGAWLVDPPWIQQALSQ